MSKPPINWTEIFLLAILLTVGIPIVAALSVATRGVLPILFVCCLAFSYVRAKWRQHRGVQWYQ